MARTVIKKASKMKFVKLGKAVSMGEFFRSKVRGKKKKKRGKR